MANSKNIIEFTLAYNRYKAQVYNYVLKMISNKMVCEDIIQNVFLKLYENLENIRNKSSIQFWIFRTARNEVYTYFRTKKVRVDQFNVEDTDDLEIDDGGNLAVAFEMKEVKELILKELESMPYEQKEIYLLKEYGGLSYKEISSIMNIDENLVKSRLFKVRQKLARRIARVY
ncbi:MAG: RNA polymerase sigma factor [Melioribacteraceae bacterium]|nr:RNA polymerase sigma factor [Melioribacteraceae bacterium]